MKKSRTVKLELVFYTAFFESMFARLLNTFYSTTIVAKPHRIKTRGVSMLDSSVAIQSWAIKQTKS
jgi:hypothetical protein